MGPVSAKIGPEVVFVRVDRSVIEARCDKTGRFAAVSGSRQMWPAASCLERGEVSLLSWAIARSMAKSAVVTVRID